MKKTSKIKSVLTLAALALAAALWFVPHQSAQTKETQAETAGQKFKNIKVLNDMPADQLGKVMNIMAASLGTDCAGCHVSGSKDFDKDDNPRKNTARRMLAMTFGINKEFFNGRPAVSCNTCHNGNQRPAMMPDLDAVEHPIRPQQPAVKPNVDEILKRYSNAIGSHERAAKITSRVITAKRIESDGKTIEPEQIDQANGKLRIETQYTQATIVDLFDGEKAVKTSNGSAVPLRPEDSQQIEREARLFGNPDLRSVYSKFEYRFTERVNGRDAFVVFGTVADGSSERLYFDPVSGLLVRRVASVPTVLGQFQFQTDYSAYKDFGGIKLPTTVRFAKPGVSWARFITKVRLNAAIPEGRLTDGVK